MKASAATRPGWRLIDLLAVLLAAGLIAASLWHLFGAYTGLRIVEESVDGIPVTVIAAEDARPAPVVVIGHGFAGSRQFMHPFAVTLARNGYLTVLFDFPGHGRNRNLLRGEIGEPERTESLLDAWSRVVDFARTLPGGDGRLALVGHSMAGDILARYAEAHPGVDAAVAVSPYLSQDLGADGPTNLLFVYGGLEPQIIMQQGREALAAVAGVSPDAVELGVTYGDIAAGNARRMLIADGVEHIGVLYSSTALQAAVDWLNLVLDRQSAAAIDDRGPWLGLFFAGVVLLGWPLSRLLPQVSPAPLGAGLGWRRLLPIAIAPAILTPLLLWPVPTDFLSVVIGDYIALHFAVYGLLVWIGLWLAGQRPMPGIKAALSGAFLIALVAVALFEIVAITLPTDRFVASFLPGLDRLPTVLAIFAGTLLWFTSDEWLTRGRAPRFAYPLTKLLFLISLMLAVVLNLNELFFLVIIIPAILALFIVYGLFSRWIYRRTLHPWVAGLTNALAFAGAIAVSFPMVG